MYLQLAADPVVMLHENVSSVRVLFGNRLVLLEEEVLELPLEDFVADCGGTFGLFVGFNFLTMWDLSVNFVIKIIERFKYN